MSSEQELEQPVAGEHPGLPAAHRRPQTFNEDYVDKLVVSATASHALREQFRRVAATLHHSQEEAGLKTIMVTSACQMKQRCGDEHRRTLSECTGGGCCSSTRPAAAVTRQRLHDAEGFRAQ